MPPTAHVHLLMERIPVAVTAAKPSPAPPLGSCYHSSALPSPEPSSISNRGLKLISPDPGFDCPTVQLPLHFQRSLPSSSSSRPPARPPRPRRLSFDHACQVQEEVPYLASHISNNLKSWVFFPTLGLSCGASRATAVDITKKSRRGQLDCRHCL